MARKYENLTNLDLDLEIANAAQYCMLHKAEDRDKAKKLFDELTMERIKRGRSIKPVADLVV